MLQMPAKRYSSFFSVILIVSLLFWFFDLKDFIKPARASITLTSISDFMSNSNPSANSNHTIRFTTPNGGIVGKKIRVTFPSGFGLSSLIEDDVDISANGTPLTTGAGTCSGSNASVGFSGQIVSFELCTGGTIASASTVSIKIGTIASGSGSGTHRISNNASAASYQIDVAGTIQDSGSTQVALVSSVDMSASVSTNFTFTVSGVAAGQPAVNTTGTTSITTTATSIPWGTISSGHSYKAAQSLAVTTNAANGFLVKLFQDHNLLSGNNADIDVFKDGAATAAPTAWASPSANVLDENSFGQYGVNTNDLNLGTDTGQANDTFASSQYVGNISSASPSFGRNVMGNSGPSDGVTKDRGANKIGFRIEISSLQEAANDYRNKIYYIATPTF